MSQLTENLSKVQDQIIETLSSFQEPVVKLVTKLSDVAEERLPEVPEVEAAERIPDAQEFVDNQFAFAERVLKNQHDFATAVIAAAKPVTEKASPKPAAKASTKSGAKKSTKAAA